MLVYFQNSALADQMAQSLVTAAQNDVPIGDPVRRAIIYESNAALWTILLALDIGTALAFDQIAMQRFQQYFAQAEQSIKL